MRFTLTARRGGPAGPPRRAAGATNGWGPRQRLWRGAAGPRIERRPPSGSAFALRFFGCGGPLVGGTAPRQQPRPLEPRPRRRLRPARQRRLAPRRPPRCFHTSEASAVHRSTHKHCGLFWHEPKWRPERIILWGPTHIIWDASPLLSVPKVPPVAPAEAGPSSSHCPAADLVIWCARWWLLAYTS